MSRTTSITEHSTLNLNTNQTADIDTEHLHDLLNTATSSLLDKTNDRSSKMTKSNSSAANLTC